MSRAFETPNQGYTGEFAQSGPEAFMPLGGARQLVQMAMAGRISSEGRLLPLEEEQTLMNVPGFIMKPLSSEMRYDMILPPEKPITQPLPEGGRLVTDWNYDVASTIYLGLLQEHKTSLDEIGANRVRHDRVQLEQALARRPDLKWRFGSEQSDDAYHIKQENTPHPGSDGLLAQPVRIYVPSGLQGARIAREIIDRGANFAYAKIWVPQVALGEQAFRQDTPIFEVNDARQLRSVVAALRSIAAREPASFYHPYSPVGIPIMGANGATIAQPKRGSFNGEMANFWAGPIGAACNSLPLRAGDVVTKEWLDEAAFRAQSIAYQQAKFAGVNPACHAIQPEQSLDVILDAARSN